MVEERLEQHLLVLLIRLGVVASLASILVRSGGFKRLLLREERTLNQRLLLALSFASIFGAGVAIRVVQHYPPVDLGLEGALVAGLVGGYVTGLFSGALIAIPAMIHHEYLTLPLLVGVGALGGLLRDGAPDTEEVWRFSPSSTSACTASLPGGATTSARPFRSSSCWPSCSRSSCG